MLFARKYSFGPYIYIYISRLPDSPILHISVPIENIHQRGTTYEYPMSFHKEASPSPHPERANLNSNDGSAIDGDPKGIANPTRPPVSYAPSMTNDDSHDCAGQRHSTDVKELEQNCMPLETWERGRYFQDGDWCG